MLTPPLVGYLLYNFIINNKRVKTALVFSLIFVSSLIAIFSLYYSPITMLRNQQNTIMDVSGMNWIITEKNLEFTTGDIASPVFRFADLIYGFDFRLQRQDLSRRILPDHFGGIYNKTFPIDEDRYLVITEFDMNPSIMKQWKDFDPAFVKEDFIKITSCTNVDKIYENGEFRSYLVHKR